MSTWLSAHSEDGVLVLMQRFPDARLLAGGTDLLVRLRREAPAAPWPLISLEQVAPLQGIAETHEKGMMLTVGAMTRIAELCRSPLLAAQAPLLQTAALSFGAPAIRNMATLGGNLCTASPAGDCLPPLYALGAEVELLSPAGRRRVPIDQFILAPGQTTRRPGELLTRVLLPSRLPFAWQTFDKVGRRQSLAISVVSFAGLLRDQRVAETHLAWGSVGPTVISAPGLVNLMLGQKIDQTLINRATELARLTVQPINDLRAGADYRCLLAGNLLRRFLSQARPNRSRHG